MQIIDFLKDLLRDADRSHTVIIFDEDGLEHPRRHVILPVHLLWLGGATVGMIGLIFFLAVVLTPLGSMLPGTGSDEMVRDIRLGMLRLQAMQDSLEAQQRYLAHLRHVVVGQIDSVSMAAEFERPQRRNEINTDVANVASENGSQDWSAHAQPAVSFWRFQTVSEDLPRTVASAERSLAGLQLPVLPPVSGFMTRGFDARLGHFGVDFAVEEGSIVRAVGDGYVIFADWSHEGGHTIAVQHADGYVSIYKHNQRLLKRVGERVRARESIAISGDTGEASTGPHLHFEFWQNGLAQDPRYYFLEK